MSASPFDDTAWGDLAATAPLVVAGPVLRRVDDLGVTVFIVTREPRQITLEVIPASGPADAPPLLTGTAATVALGSHAHVVAVTAAGGALDPGTAYRYRVGFTAAGSGRQDLMDPGVAATTTAQARALFCYPAPAPDLPGFVTAPSTADGLRVLHGGARRPHAAGLDMLAHADTVIAGSLPHAVSGAAAGRRPHLLLLHGDQITASDVADTTLSVVRSAVAALGIRDDVLPGADASQQPGVLGPGSRAALCESAKLPAASSSHLLSFAEYAAMQLLAWTDTLWPADLPSVEAVHPDPGWAGFPAGLREKILTGETYEPTAAQRPLAGKLSAWRDDQAALKTFRAGLPAVRRVLANVPVLTGLGEHDVSPGWNRGTAEATALLTHATGRRVVQNALAAHAVLRAWGNTPEQFSGPASPGRLLLDALTGWLNAPASGENAQSAAIAARVGVPDSALARPAGALDYHYLVTGRGWHLLVLDVATRRSLAVAARDRRPVGDAALDAMLDLLPEARNDTLTLIASAVPLHRLPPGSGRTVATDQTGSWAADTAGYHHVLTRLATRRVPGDAGGTRRRQLVFLAGGSGHAFADTVQLSAERAYRTAGATPAAPVPAEAVIGHLVAGCLRGVTRDDRALHMWGYDTVDGNRDLGRVVGWDETNPPVVAGVQLRGEGIAPVPWQITGSPQVAELDARRRLDRRPHWLLGTTLFVATPGTSESTPRPELPVPVGPDVLDEAYQDEASPDQASPVPRVTPRTFVDALLNHRSYRSAWRPGNEIVGREALSEVAFTFHLHRQAAVQAAHFALDGLPAAAPYSAFPVSFDFRPSLYLPALYASLALRREDIDPRAGTAGRHAGRATTVGTHVRDLQDDLAELGFTVVRGDAPGHFGPHTEWGVREFQAYAKNPAVARESDDPDPNPRYAARLSAATAAEDQWYAGPISGVVNGQTRWVVALWKKERWRCPVVVEAFSGGTPATPAPTPVPNMGNLWRQAHPTGRGNDVYVTDFSGRYAVPPAYQVPQPDGLPAGTYRVGLGVRSTYTQLYTRTLRLGQPPVEVEHEVRVNFGGGMTSDAETSSWQPHSEVYPEYLLPAAPGGTRPTLGDLVTAADNDPADGRLSTFKVVRAVAEVESLGYFDVLNGYDSAFLSGGLCHWTMGAMDVPDATLANHPKWNTTTTPPTRNAVNTINASDAWDVSRGELWGFLSLLRSRLPDAYQKYFGFTGITPVATWGQPGLWDEAGRKYVSRAQQETETGVAIVPQTVREYNRFRGWHWCYRLSMAFRVEDAFRRAMWGAARQRIADVLGVSWPQDALAANGARLPDTTLPDGTTRRPTIGEVFTSERAIGLIYRWHVNAPAHMVHKVPIGQGNNRVWYVVAGGYLQRALAEARARPGANNLQQPLATWGDAEERLLIDALLAHPGNDALTTTLPMVDTWPTWAANPYHWSLPVTQLPLADPPTAPEPRRRVSERHLRPDRHSFRFDATDLPWTGTPH